MLKLKCKGEDEMTAHIESKKEEIAKRVLMPGDPLRAKYVASKFLTDAKCINQTRGMLGFTGKYKGVDVTIFASGMGGPSIGIYAYELYKFYGVETIIRVGTCGSLSSEFKVLETVLLDGSYTESNFALAINRDKNTFLVEASQQINQKILETANEKNFLCKHGYGFCNEVFDPYLDDNQFQELLLSFPKNISIVVSEMEAFALFYIASLFEKQAACLLTIVDSKYQSDIVITSEEREKKLDDMIILALETSLKI